jgi:hypothetical protein
VKEMIDKLSMNIQSLNVHWNTTSILNTTFCKISFGKKFEIKVIIDHSLTFLEYVTIVTDADYAERNVNFTKSERIIRKKLSLSPEELYNFILMQITLFINDELCADISDKYLLLKDSNHSNSNLSIKKETSSFTVFNGKKLICLQLIPKSHIEFILSEKVIESIGEVKSLSKSTISKTILSSNNLCNSNDKYDLIEKLKFILYSKINFSQ